MGAGHRVIASDDGRKALELAAVARPVVVVLDLVTLGKDGWEFLERRAREPALLGVPVVIVAGTSGALPANAAAVLRRPFEPSALLERVGALIRSRGA